MFNAALTFYAVIKYLNIINPLNVSYFCIIIDILNGLVFLIMSNILLGRIKFMTLKIHEHRSLLQFCIILYRHMMEHYFRKQLFYLILERMNTHIKLQ